MGLGERSRLIVQHRHHPWMRRAAVIGGTVLALALGWGLYALGKARTPEDWQHLETARERLEGERRRLLGENRRLEDENRRLNERLVALERAADVDREAIAGLRQSLRDMQDRLSEYKKELAFYRGIVSPEEAEAGVRIQRFGLAPTAEGGVYRFDLVLIQAARHDRRVDGRVRLRFEGLREGESQSLGWSDVALDSASKLVFSFKYFQELTGTFRLPQAFEPTLVEVRVALDEDGAGTFAESYDWRRLVESEGRFSGGKSDVGQ